jgi:DNA/RNA-binding domain of Phe-tRNA-synthetase-like protein
MKITFSEKIRNSLNSIRLGVIEFNCTVELADKEFWIEIEEFSKQIRNRYTLDEVNKIDTISATRNAYKKCGKDPNRYRPSADSLIRRIVKGNTLYKVNNVVDVLNLISIQSGFSIGGYDVGRINGETIMDIGETSDDYTGIGRGELNIEGLPVLRDKQGVFGTPTSDSERTMITGETKNCVFVFFDFGLSNKLDSAIEKTVELLKNYTNAENVLIEIQKM